MELSILSAKKHELGDESGSAKDSSFIIAPGCYKYQRTEELIPQSAGHEDIPVIETNSGTKFFKTASLPNQYIVRFKESIQLRMPAIVNFNSIPIQLSNLIGLVCYKIKNIL